MDPACRQQRRIFRRSSSSDYFSSGQLHHQGPSERLSPCGRCPGVDRTGTSHYGSSGCQMETTVGGIEIEIHLLLNRLSGRLAHEDGTLIGEYCLYKALGFLDSLPSFGTLGLTVIAMSFHCWLKWTQLLGEARQPTMRPSGNRTALV